MPVREGIYDRVDIVKMLSDACLGGPGTSAVILGGQKVGKTHLLEHICALPPASMDTFLCRIDVDSLRATLPEGERLSDNTFLRYFFEVLQNQIGGQIDAQNLDKDRWVEGIQDAVDQLDSLPDIPGNAAARNAYELKKAAWSAKLAELRGLRLVDQAIASLLTQAEPLRASQAVSVFNRLSAIRKRTILVIDEFHRMLTDSAFSDNLFSFLRGANNERKIVALLSSTVSLMDPSLHAGTQANDRPALFNHYHTRYLEPFTASQAAEFLEWAHGQDAGVLSQEDKDYLVELGGGSPYFLLKARELFVARDRPAAPTRVEFEQAHLVPVLESAMRDIWRRCGPADREALLQVAAGNPLPEGEMRRRLEREGYLLRSAASVGIFSRVFKEFISKQTGDWVGSEIEVTAELLEGALPSALYFGKPDIAAPVVTFTIRNPTAESIAVRMSCTLNNYATPVARLVNVPARSTGRHSLQVTFQPQEFARLTDVVNTTLSYTAEVLRGTSRSLVVENTVTIMLLGRTDFLMARREKTKLRDLSWLIAAWVGRSPALAPIKKRAAARGVVFQGYGTPTVEGIRAQVEALYEELRSEGITYDNTTLSFYQAASDFVQRVRSPGEVLGQKLANCIDAVVLFASLLESSDLHPIILLVPGHAVVGWRTADAANASCEFLEMTADVPFGEAHKIGQAVYGEIAAGLIRTWPAADSNQFIADSSQFAIAVDVHEVKRVLRVISLPS